MFRNETNYVLTNGVLLDGTEKMTPQTVPDYLVYLERAGMIGLLRDDTSGMRNLGKVEKVYVDNPSLMSVLTSNPNIGNIRETFFYNQMREKQ